jgi:hypothetical protein
MKTLTLILSLVISCVALAQEPAELERLRHLWEQSVAKEFDKKNKVYLKSLEKLQKKFTEANNLAAAVAVNHEIKMVRLLKPEQQRKSPVEGAWIMTYHGRNYMRVFLGDVLIGRNGERTKWTIKDNTIVAGYDTMEFNPDNPNRMEGVNKAGSKLTFTRVK